MNGKGVRINFQGAKASLDFQYPLETDIDCLAQNAVVNVATLKGSDSIYKDKGSELRSTMMSGVAFNEIAAGHVASYAAVKTKRFVNSVVPLTQDDILDSFELEVDGVSDEGIGWKFKARVKSTLGTESTVTWSINP